MPLASGADGFHLVSYTQSKCEVYSQLFVGGPISNWVLSFILLKSGVASTNVAVPVTREYDVPLMVARGYSSETFAYKRERHGSWS